MRECYVDVRKRSLNSPTGRLGEQLRGGGGGGGLLGLSADRPSGGGGSVSKEAPWKHSVVLLPEVSWEQHLEQGR